MAMNEAHILLIDDDRDLAELLGEYLDAEGFRLSAAHSGEEGIQELSRGDYDLVLLDVMMPGIDGFETLKQIRNTSAVPVLMLTAKGEETDRVLGLELGADDYLAKPYSHRELLARIKALLRRIELDRAQKENDTGTLECNGVTLNFDTYEVDCDGQTLPMTTSEFKVLRVLMSRAGKAVPKEDLYREVLGREIMAYDRSIDMHVSNVRRKIQTVTEDPKIQTIRGIGYLFVEAS
ncbi:response regulator transcription factor [Saccharospirillum sp. HFRX-1]|uniref:response regulator n=1 Tax=unclassified Saccharospirillum TaxID=2633430 RepID=UPI00372049B5